MARMMDCRCMALVFRAIEWLNRHVGVIATGDTFAEALEHVAEGMFSLIADLDSVQPKESLKLSVESMDTDTLVVDWLNELLYRFDSEGFLPREFEVTLGKDERSLKAWCIGERVDRVRLQANDQRLTLLQFDAAPVGFDTNLAPRWSTTGEQHGRYCHRQRNEIDSPDKHINQFSLPWAILLHIGAGDAAVNGGEIVFGMLTTCRVAREYAI